MKLTYRTLAAAALIAVSFSAAAQTQVIPTPASSVGGSGLAVVAITMPAVDPNVCTALNGKCYSATTPPPAPNQGYAIVSVTTTNIIPNYMLGVYSGGLGYANGLCIKGYTDFPNLDLDSYCPAGSGFYIVKLYNLDDYKNNN